jgi:hypothetical protein
MPEDPATNSEEAQRQVTAAFDSVWMVDAAVAGDSRFELPTAEETAAERLYHSDRNYKHLETMMAKTWFSDTLTAEQTTSINNSISSAKAYITANS